MSERTRILPRPVPTTAQVQDPAVRAILRTVSRALKMIIAAIDQHCGKEGEMPP